MIFSLPGGTVTRDVAPDPAVQKIADYWTARGSALAARPLAKQTGDFTRTQDGDGESTMGDLAADVQYWAAGTAGKGRADLALGATKPATGSNAVAWDLPYAKGTGAGDAD